MTKPVERNVVIVGKQRTSQSAAEKMFYESGTWRKRVYDFVVDKGFNGATDQEMQEYFQKSGDTIRPVRISLVKDLILMDSGRTRANSSGNQCIIWTVNTFEGMLI
jgi:hypothetical protein